MRAYHLRNIIGKYKKDYIYIPDKSLLIAHFQGEFNMKMDYSMPYYLQMANNLINRKPDALGADIVKEFEIDEMTAEKIDRNKSAFLNGSIFDNSTEGLVKILSEEKIKKSNW